MVAVDDKAYQAYQELEELVERTDLISTIEFMDWSAISTETLKIVVEKALEDKKNKNRSRR